jgi:hypothetical protein
MDETTEECVGVLAALNGVGEQQQGVYLPHEILLDVAEVPDAYRDASSVLLVTISLLP